MPRKKAETESGNTRWTATDYAKLKFFIYKDASHAQAAVALGRTPHASAQAYSKILEFERGAMPRNTHQYKLIQDGLVLEMSVRGGQYPDQRQLWLNQLSVATGITYHVPTTPVAPPTPPVVETPPEPKAEPKPFVTMDDVRKDSPIKEMLRVSVTVNVNSITSLIKAVKKAWTEES